MYGEENFETKRRLGGTARRRRLNVNVLGAGAADP